MSDILTLDTGLYNSIFHPDIIQITICMHYKHCVNEVVLVCQFVLSSYCKDCKVTVKLL